MIFGCSLTNQITNEITRKIKMRVLHISNGFAESKVHSNLARALDVYGIEQTIYCPVREGRLLGKNQFDSKRVKFVYSNCIKSWYKYVYFYKERKLYQDLKMRINLSGIDFIHAHTMFSDGGLAYKAHKELGIPYAVAIRNTDVNYFLRLMRHAYPYGRKVLQNAEKIFFISEGLKMLFEESTFCESIYESIKDKFVVQPNGIEDFWHEHINHDSHTGHNVLYIGDFTPNKNVGRLVEAVKRVRTQSNYHDCRLVIVGGGRDKNGEVEALIKENSAFVEYLGKIYNMDRLLEVMKSSAIFAMPSITETFGLVYVESLSQNLPVIYTKKQGIDGFFDESVGLSVNPHSVEDVSNAIIRIFNNPQDFNNRNVDFNWFKWGEIAKRYKMIYDSYLS